jgi:hypothetical protein
MIRATLRGIHAILPVFGVLAILFSWGAGGVAQTPHPAPAPTPVPLMKVTLSAVPSASTYNLGDTVVVDWVLTNQSSISVGLSDRTDGNIVVTSFTRNGVGVPALPTISRYEDGFATALASSLRSVAPGGSLSSPWTSDANQEVGGEALLAVRYSRLDRGDGSYYSLAAPGTYSLTFYYQYRGPTSTFPGTVFLGKTNSVTVTFTVL